MTAKALGINHVALCVGDLDEALDFYGKVFEFELRGRNDHGAFIDLGDQFIALMKTDIGSHRHREQHFGLVVDDKQAVVAALDKAGIERLDDGFLDFLDPWGNRIQVVDYKAIQFTKSPAVLKALGAGGLEKTQEAQEELAKKGMLFETN